MHPQNDKRLGSRVESDLPDEVGVYAGSRSSHPENRDKNGRLSDEFFNRINPNSPLGSSASQADCIELIVAGTDSFSERHMTTKVLSADRPDQPLCERKWHWYT